MNTQTKSLDLSVDGIKALNPKETQGDSKVLDLLAAETCALMNEIKRMTERLDALKEFWKPIGNTATTGYVVTVDRCDVPRLDTVKLYAKYGRDKLDEAGMFKISVKTTVSVKRKD